MKQPKERVIAIDYFRGICILMVLLDHSALFSWPYYYLAGGGVLWTTAAEIFLLLSGLTLWIVRSDNMSAGFLPAATKIWRRTAITYAIYMTTVFISIGLLLVINAHGWTNGVLGVLPGKLDFSFLFRLLTLQYSVGWANFLLYYCVFLLISPFALYTLKTRYWLVTPITSILIFLSHASPEVAPSLYGSLMIWQVYFFIGLTLGKFRVTTLKKFFHLSSGSRRVIATTIASVSISLLCLSILYEFNLWPTFNSLAISGWIPLKISSAYSLLMAHKASVDFWLLNGRYGALRPASTLLLLGGGYVLYQRYKTFLLARTGHFINTMGKDSLWIFVAQSVAIPLLALLPLSRNYVNNLLLTSCLIISMWAVTRRKQYMNKLKLYALELKTSYSEAKYAYLRQYEDSN